MNNEPQAKRPAAFGCGKSTACRQKRCRQLLRFHKIWKKTELWVEKRGELWYDSNASGDTPN